MVDIDPPEMSKKDMEDFLKRSFEVLSGKFIYPYEESDIGLQDGMLAYYLSQARFSDAHDDDLIAKTYFDLRDQLGVKKK